QILSPDLVAGPHYKVDETVTNDGYLNNYTIHSEYGDVQATSTAKLRKYIREIAAVAEMKKISSSEEFAKGMTDKAGAVVEGAANLVSDPVGTVSSTVSGVGKLFSRAGENLTGSSRSEAEGSRMASLLGYEQAKRDIGYKFGVDVYSDNKILQDELNNLSGASGTGTLVMSGLLMAVPGGAGIAVSVTGGTEMMEGVMKDSAPADLRKINREKLAAMGVSRDVADIFIANGIYTPREQTYLVGALADMKNTANRGEYIKYSTLADNPDVAYFRQRQAQMYEAYDRIVEPIDSLVTIGGLSTARTKSGKIVFNVPLDYMLWTKGLSALADTINQQVAAMEGITGKEILVTGTMSPLAKESIEKMGWIVHEKTEKKLSLPGF
ncbi:MAG: hypothetical protein ACRESK_05090, partial [Gammaproteobacteria bacterium]